MKLAEYLATKQAGRVRFRSGSRRERDGRQALGKWTPHAAPGANAKNLQRHGRRGNAERLSPYASSGMTAWTPERRLRLRVLAADGLTMTQIALELGCSRNMVAGMCNREHISIGAARKSAVEALKKRQPPKEQKPLPRHYSADWGSS